MDIEIILGGYYRKVFDLLFVDAILNEEELKTLYTKLKGTRGGSIPDGSENIITFS